MTKHFVPSPQQIFPKTVLGCFRLGTFLPYRFQGNEGEGQAGVAAKPKQEGDVEGGLREGVAGSAHLGGSTGGGTRSGHGGKVGVGDVGKGGGVTNHLEVSALLLGRHGDLVPNVHPVAVLAVNALATNLDLNLGNELLTDKVQPAGIDTGVGQASVGANHLLVDLGEGDLEVCAVAQIAVTRDCAGHTATKIGLAGESLLNALHGKVCVASVRHLPKGDLGGSRKEHVLCAVGDQLHKSSSHVCGFI